MFNNKRHKNCAHKKHSVGEAKEKKWGFARMTKIVLDDDNDGFNDNYDDNFGNFDDDYDKND